jgi:hypothetical protein
MLSARCRVAAGASHSSEARKGGYGSSSCRSQFGSDRSSSAFGSACAAARSGARGSAGAGREQRGVEHRRRRCIGRRESAGAVLHGGRKRRGVARCAEGGGGLGLPGAGRCRGELVAAAADPRHLVEAVATLTARKARAGLRRSREPKPSGWRHRFFAGVSQVFRSSATRRRPLLDVFGAGASTFCAPARSSPATWWLLVQAIARALLGQCPGNHDHSVKRTANPSTSAR